MTRARALLWLARRLSWVVDKLLVAARAGLPPEPPRPTAFPQLETIVSRAPLGSHEHFCRVAQLPNFLTPPSKRLPRERA